MFINCNKTKCITVGTKQKLAFQNEEVYLTFNSEQLQHSAWKKLLGIKIIHLVLLQFINILLSLHHNSILFKSSWTLVCISEIFFPEMCIVELSAYISVLQFEILKGRSFIYKINNNGPSNKIELWCKDNNMFINCNKTKCITVGTKQKLAFQNEEVYLTFNSEQLQHSAWKKLLGP
jgi:uncharacterized protein YsxB (DUF464 family)